jgi:small-conductance mechanosensitive channel
MLGLVRAIVLLAVLCLAPASGGAQDSDATISPDLARAISAATQSGVGVIVVDAQGRVVEPPQEPVSETPVAQSVENPAASTLMAAQERGESFRRTLRQRLQDWDNSLNEVAYILRATSPDGRIMTYVEAVFFSILLFLFARFVTYQVFALRIARGFVVSRVMDAPVGYRQKMPFLAMRFFVGTLATVITMAVAYVTGALIFGPVDDVSMQFTIAAIYTAYFVVRVISDLWRMILSPYLSQYRIPKFSDADARKLYFWAVTLAYIDVVVIMVSTWLYDFGLNYNLYALSYGAMALVGMSANILMVLFNRRAISNALRNGRAEQDVPWIQRVLSRIWAPVLIGYFIFGWLELAFDLVLEQPVSVPLIAGAYAVLMSIIIVYGVINFVIERLFERARLMRAVNDPPEPEEGEPKDDSESERPFALHQMTSFEELARRVSGIIAFVVGAYALLRIWDQQEMVLRDSIVDRTLDVVVIIFIGYIVYHAFRIWIDNKIADETMDAPEAELGDEGGASSASRLATLLPLFRNFILVVVVVSIGLIALLEMGINVSPLFAGAGVVGLAVGFGAQALVRDIFSGAFFLIDDAFRKGEYIDIGSVKGTVEKISVRSFQLRHHLGALHTIPFGEIQVLTNYSRDWVIMKLPLRVTYDTDVEKVRKLIKKLGQELLSDPVIGDNFIQPLKSQGVIEMQDSAMIIRVKFMTKPGDQWLVRKKVFEEIRALFEREGIKFAHREVTVRIAEDQAANMNPQQREAVTGAVQAAIEEDMMEGGPPGDDR